jgi:2-polyprenyl-3-methyl-5-hydroxy-6-metoxy-1,4-benzoquinol methylase
MPSRQECDTAPGAEPRAAGSPAPGYYGNERPEVVKLVPAEGARILDVGCAGGAMGRALKQRGAREVVGIELMAEVAEQARPHLDAVHVLDVQRAELPYPDAYFDVMTFADVLEHLTDPAAVLRKLRRHLRDEGMIVCSIPNVRHESVALRLLVEGHWRYQDEGILDRTHLRFFTFEELAPFLRGAGFELHLPVTTVRTRPSPRIEALAGVVAQLGGDAEKFRIESTVFQYVFQARPLPADPWQGARAVRVLVVPGWDDPADCWSQALSAFCAGIGAADPITIGVVGPASGPPPDAFTQLAGRLRADLRLLTAPADEAAWQRLTGGARMFVATSDRPDLLARARAAGLELFDGRQMRGP